VTLPIPHPKQDEILKSRARFKVLVCGRRSGKTTLALIEILVRAFQHERSLIYYIAPTYRQAKSIFWRMLDDALENVTCKRNESELSFKLPNRSVIELKGADNPDSLRGIGLDFAVLDEFAAMKPTVWDEIISPALADKKGDAWFIGTPNGFDHFYNIWDDAKRRGEDWECFRFSTYENPFVPKSEIDAKRKTTDPDTFAQEYLAEFVRFEGLVYKGFKRDIHVQPFEPDLTYDAFIPMDYGYSNPTAILWAYYKDNHYYFRHEFYKQHQGIDDIASVMNERAVMTNDKFIDPSAEGIRQELMKKGIPFSKANNDVEGGIQKVAELFASNRITIHPDCVNLIRELEFYRWEKEIDEKNNKINPLKFNDHAVDALRYGILSYVPGDKKHKGKIFATPNPYQLSIASNG